MNFGPGNRFPYAVHGAMEAQLASLAAKIVDGVCKLLLPNTLSQLTAKTNRPLVAECERLMTESRRLCDSVELEAAQKMRVVGRMDVRLVLHICKKGKDFEDTVLANVADITKVYLHSCAPHARTPAHA